ncbi:hypothetical protein [Cupriavidus sp. UYPR2.512]|uniref:hypothetical protein n=1 Tax=Cupriavidus sp. UYPR2.512 TaxID=1080187 RepID=UPI00036CB7D5|nr:hypothetical protein [Cupriavidus sp. UYPR2.512]UIF90936.1 hypothetical protein KAF44_32650 [Cupriavidus necator]
MAEKLDLEALEKLASAAHQHGENIGEPEWYPAGDGDIWIADSNPESPYVRAMSPETTLALIACIREQDAALKRQAASARLGMDAAKAAAAVYYRLGAQALDEAGRLAAQTSFAELESQRSANAILTAENERLSKDAERLDWLDQVNRATNERNDTTYGWRFDINHNRAALMDHNLPALSVRQAIDAAKEVSNG